MIKVEQPVTLLNMHEYGFTVFHTNNNEGLGANHLPMVLLSSFGYKGLNRISEKTWLREIGAKSRTLGA